MLRSSLCGACCTASLRRFRCFSSATSTNAADDRVTKILLRHFLFQTHPDFFAKHKTEQAINSQNYAKLQDVHAKLVAGFDGPMAAGGVRTLVFYVKPTERDPVPRRVKVFIGSLRSLEESVVDILDTAGATLPSDIRDAVADRHAASASGGGGGGGAKSEAFVMSGAGCTPAQAVAFLDTLVDRRDLMAWRQDRAKGLTALLEVVKGTLGVDAVDIRYSWSAQNNATLLDALLALATPPQVYATLGCPWRNMTLVLSADDCSEAPVDPVEGHVMINPGHVPLQWRAVFQEVGRPGLLDEARRARAETERLRRLFDTAASVQLQRAVAAAVNRHLQAPSSSPSPSGATPTLIVVERRHVAGLSVRVRRGFTCSARWYLSFLSRMEEATAAVIARLELEPAIAQGGEAAPGLTFRAVDPTAAANGGDRLVGNAALAPVVLQPALSSSSSSSSSAVQALGAEFAFLAHLPLTVDLVVEEGHGTKLLPSGELRLDCRATPQQVQALMAAHCLASLELSARHKVLTDSVAQLTQAVVARLRVASVEAGVGVDAATMEACLMRMKQHADAATDAGKEGRAGKLRALADMRVRIGRYLGIADDGSVTWPHDFPDLYD